MPKSDPVADALSRLKSLRADPRSIASVAELSKALQSKANILVSRAADVIHDAKLDQFVDQLVAAFDRLMVDPTSTDKGCGAKTSIAKALYELEARTQTVFLTGIHHRQIEGVWGGSTDTAAELRGICALGLVRCNYRDVMIDLGDLLMDPEPACRMMAARAIAYSENDAGLPLLRMKVLAGDQNPDVIGECFTAMLRLSPRKSVDFVSEYVDSDDDDLKQLAILSLGESRQPAALNALTEHFHRAITGDAREPLILAIALTRLPASIDFLLKVIAEEHKQLGLASIDALKMYRNDATIRARIADQIDKRDEPELRGAFDQAFHA
jgi:HEAT repeat protein